MTPRLSARWRLAAALALAAPLASCAGGGFNWGWHVVSPWTAQGKNNLGFLLEGYRWTITASLCAMALSIVLGLVVALLGMARWKPARVLARGYVELLRSVPILVMILWVFYGLPIVLGIRLDTFTAAVLAIAICDGAFEAEIFRGGIQSIEKGQHEAADSLGLSWARKMRFVILPQAIRRILPPLGNQFVYVVKMSSLASVIGLTELTRKAGELVVTVFRPLEIYTVLIAEYLVLVVVISWLVRRMERRLGSDERFGRR